MLMLFQTLLQKGRNPTKVKKKKKTRVEKLLASQSKSHLRVKLGAADGRVIRTAGFEVCCPSPRQSRAAPPAARTGLMLGLSKMSAVSGLNHRSGARRKVGREGGGLR